MSLKFLKLAMTNSGQHISSVVGIMYCNFMIMILKSNSFLTFHYSNASMSHKCLQISNDEIRARNVNCWISISKLCNPKLIIDKSG